MSAILKEVISPFIKVNADSISESTNIDRIAVGSSILLHRMFARLADAGFVVNDYHGIKTYGDLERQLNGQNVVFTPTVNLSDRMNANEFQPELYSSLIGVDIENIDAMPRVNDFREDSFYQQNFSPGEMAYCILKPDPYASFAGLFAAKEAVIKADNRLIGTPFNLMEIQHDKNGRPYYKEFTISISHTNIVSVAVALYNNQTAAIGFTSGLSSENTGKSSPRPRNNSLFFLAVLALLFSLLALGISLLR